MQPHMQSVSQTEASGIRIRSQPGQGLWPQTLATVVTRGRTVHWDLEQQAVSGRTLLSLLPSSSWVVVLVVGKGERKESCFFTSREKPR